MKMLIESTDEWKQKFRPKINGEEISIALMSLTNDGYCKKPQTSYCGTEFTAFEAIPEYQSIYEAAAILKRYYGIPDDDLDIKDSGSKKSDLLGNLFRAVSELETKHAKESQ